MRFPNDPEFGILVVFGTSAEQAFSPLVSYGHLVTGGVVVLGLGRWIPEPANGRFPP